MITSFITPHESYPKLAEALTLKNLYFKREDLHPLGSHKGRSIPHMIDEHLKNGITHFVISSSGNAALAAARYVQQLNETRTKDSTKNTDQKAPITLEILVGKHINQHKLLKLQAQKSEHILVSMHDRPLQTLFTKTQDPSVKGLRQSTDASALVGYKTLAEEVIAIPDIAGVFIGTSSGTTAEALADYFIQNAKKIGKQIAVHIVQTSSCHPLSDAFETTEETSEQSLADAIVDHTAIRKDVLIPLIEETGGFGWVATNEQIKNAQELSTKYTGIPLSANSALSLAGLMNALYTGYAGLNGETNDKNSNKDAAIKKGTQVCIITGE